MKKYALMLALLLVSISSNAQVLAVGIPSFVFRPASQAEDEWCWAASIQMILNFYNIPVNQQMIVARVHGNLLDQPGSDEDISNGLSGWVAAVDGTKWVVSSATESGPPPDATVVQQLSESHPILLTFATGVYSGHAVVLTGATYINTFSGPRIVSLIIRDPWPSSQNIQNSGRVEIAGNELENFAHVIQSYWLVSVTRGQPGDPSPPDIAVSSSDSDIPPSPDDTPLLNIFTGDPLPPDDSASRPNSDTPPRPDDNRPVNIFTGDPLPPDDSASRPNSDTPPRPDDNRPVNIFTGDPLPPDASAGPPNSDPPPNPDDNQLVNIFSGDPLPPDASAGPP